MTVTVTTVKRRDLKNKQSTHVQYLTEHWQIAPVICTSPNQEASPSQKGWPGGPFFELVQILCVCVECVSLFYVINTGSIGSRTRHHVTGWGLPIYPSPVFNWKTKEWGVSRSSLSIIWDSIVRYKRERGVLDKSKISPGGSLF